jgi:hypothetical protein
VLLRRIGLRKIRLSEAVTIGTGAIAKNAKNKDA